MNNRVQSSPIIRRPPKRSPLLWLIPSQVLAILTAWAVAMGELSARFLLLGSLLWALLVPFLISLEAGLTAILVFEPFHGFLRRAQYIFVPYSETEPIHLIAPIATLFAFLTVIFRHRLDTFRLTPLAGWVTVLSLICFVQVFNPLQGGLFVGLTGGLFYLVPMAWFYFGQTANREFLPKILRMIVVLGIVTSLYGVYQMIFGYPFFELYWIQNTDLYSSIAVFNAQRPLATFSNAEEWGRFLLLGIIISVGFGLSRSEGNRRVLWFTAAAFLCLMLVLSGQRTSIFGVLAGVVILFLTGAKSFGGAVARILLILLPVILFAVLIKPPGEEDGYDLDESDRVGAMISHTTKGTVNPTGEGSLYARFQTWATLVTVVLPSNPLGNGLGSESLAANREDGNNKRAIDNYFLSLAVSAGIPALLIVLLIVFRAFFYSYRGWRNSVPNSREADLWRIVMALMSSYILNNFFGTSFLIYSVAPVGWLLIGWISAAYGETKSVKARSGNDDEGIYEVSVIKPEQKINKNYRNSYGKNPNIRF